jgi:hypothetical protein
VRHDIGGKELAGLYVVPPIAIDQQVDAGVLVLPDQVDGLGYRTDKAAQRLAGGQPLPLLGWKKLGLEQSLGTRLVIYADDLVILCRRGNAEAALHHLREIMGKLKLTVNEDKTRICRVPEGEFDFLRFTFRQCSLCSKTANVSAAPGSREILGGEAGLERRIRTVVTRQRN